MLFSMAGCKSNGNSNNADNNTNNEIQQDTEQNNDAAYAETVAEYFPTDSDCITAMQRPVLKLNIPEKVKIRKPAV